MAKLTKPIQSVAFESGFNLLDLLLIIADNLRLLILGPVIAGVLALGYSYTITPTFTATTKFLPPKQQKSGTSVMLANLGGLDALAGLTGGAYAGNQYAAFLSSRTMQDTLVDRFKLMERPGIKLRQDARNVIRGSILITNGKDGMITVDASDKDPVFAAQLANAHVEELSNLMHHFAITEAKQRRIFLEGQLNSVKSTFQQAAQALKISGVNSSVLKSNGAAVAEIAGLKGQITAQEIKISSMRGYLTDAAPDFKQAKTVLAALHAQLNIIEKTEPTSMDTHTGKSDYVARYRDFKYYETLLALFTSQYDMARIDESREAEPIQVVDVAAPPDFQSKPQKAQIVLNAVLGTGIALLLFVFIRKTIYNGLKSQKSASKLNRLSRTFTAILR